MSRLVNHHRQKLRVLLSIAKEEGDDIRFPAEQSSDWLNIDGVRYAGYTDCGFKKSIKIMNATHFLGSQRVINILSLKDKRVYERASFSGAPAYTLQPATRLASGLTVLHDPWVAPALDGHDASFGVTSDLLMTGVWLHGERIGEVVRAKLLEHATAADAHLSAIGFARNHRFAP